MNRCGCGKCRATIARNTLTVSGPNVERYCGLAGRHLKHTTDVGSITPLAPEAPDRPGSIRSSHAAASSSESCRALLSVVSDPRDSSDRLYGCKYQMEASKRPR